MAMRHPIPAATLVASCLLAMASAMSPALAQGQFLGRDEPEAEEPQQVRAYGAEDRFELVRSSGRQMPLAKAVSAIIPRGFAIRTIGIDRAWLEQPVSWSGGREWPEVLREALSAYPELVIDISLGAKTVILRQRHRNADPTVPREITGYAAEQARAEAQKEGARPGRWDVKPSDKSLRGTLQRWSEAGGWQLSWELTVDFPVSAGASIGGSYEEAVVTIVKSMEKAETPLKAIFYKGNRVVRIVAKGNE